MVRAAAVPPARALTRAAAAELDAKRALRSQPRLRRARSSASAVEAGTLRLSLEFEFEFEPQSPEGSCSVLPPSAELLRGIGRTRVSAPSWKNRVKNGLAPREMLMPPCPRS